MLGELIRQKQTVFWKNENKYSNQQIKRLLKAIDCIISELLFYLIHGIRYSFL